MSNTKIYFLMIICTIFWAGAFIAAKLSTPFIPPFTLTFLRFSVAALILYIIMKWKGQEIYKLTKKDIPVFLTTGLVGMFGYHVLFFIALKHTTAINSSIIGASNPIITAVLSIIFLKDRLNYKRVFSMEIFKKHLIFSIVFSIMLEYDGLDIFIVDDSQVIT